ncbi:hypothetical protein CONPUDRAFT_59583, partial [Coniophora puteana RWD-64-598 SS2]
STFAQALENRLPHFRRCNQDELGSRLRVEVAVRQALAEGLSVCVDRTNVDPTQRAHWINIAREFPGTRVGVIVFDTPYNVCASRLHTRTSHPTITSPEQGLSILSRFARDLVWPRAYEGQDHLLPLQPADHPTPFWTRDELVTVLRRLLDSPPEDNRPGTVTNYFPRVQGFHSRGDTARNYVASSRASPRGVGGGRGPWRASPYHYASRGGGDGSMRARARPWGNSGIGQGLQSQSARGSHRHHDTALASSTSPASVSQLSSRSFPPPESSENRAVSERSHGDSTQNSAGHTSLSGSGSANDPVQID